MQAFAEGDNAKCDRELPKKKAWRIGKTQAGVPSSPPKKQQKLPTIINFPTIAFLVLCCRMCNSWEISYVNCLPYKPTNLQTTQSQQS